MSKLKNKIIKQLKNKLEKIKIDLKETRENFDYADNHNNPYKASLCSQDITSLLKEKTKLENELSYWTKTSKTQINQ